VRPTPVLDRKPRAGPGWKPSTFDGRDYEFIPRVLAIEGDPAATTVRLRDPFPSRAQGDVVQCCVSAAVVSAMEVLDEQTPAATRLSMMFHYYVARSDPRYLSPLTLRQGLEAAVNRGVCAAEFHDPPVTREGARIKPTPEAIEAAKARRIVGYDPVKRRLEYYRLPDTSRVESWRAALAAGYPIIVGFWITAGYLNLATNGNEHGPLQNEPSTTGHAVTVQGYEDTRARFLVKDSRGVEFAEGGRWWLPYHLLDGRLVDEAWAIRKITY
jgi:hypothetical protein